MNAIRRQYPRAWVVVLIAALGLLFWANDVRIRRVKFVSGLSGWSVDRPAAAAASATGYADGVRELIVPEHVADSYHWIMQTQQMLAEKEWRVRRVAYDNAPLGRAVYSASPYRWWLGLIAWFDHAVSGRPIGLSVERAALLANPVLHALLLLSAGIFVAWRFGVFSAAMFSTAVATLFPLAGEFVPGAPDRQVLVLACVIWSILLLAAGLRSLQPMAESIAIGENKNVGDEQRRRRWFFSAGVVGGLGLWISVASLGPILLGCGVGALLGAWAARSGSEGGQQGTSHAGHWRAWAGGGAATCLTAYLVEYFPGHLGNWHLEAIHPLFGLAWLGAGELLARAVVWIQSGQLARGFRDIVAISLGVAAVAALAVAMWLNDGHGFLALDSSSARLTNLPNGTMAADFAAWVSRDGLSATVWATIVPLLLAGPAVWLILRRKTAADDRVGVAVSLGPVLGALVMAYGQLRWWNMLDATLLTMLVAALPSYRAMDSRFGLGLSACVIAAGAALGFSQLKPTGETGKETVLTESEMQGVIERDLAHWLARRVNARAGVVLAPPDQTIALVYYGGLRGLGTRCVGNEQGLATAARIFTTTSPDEAQTLIRSRGISHIVLFSWDSFFSGSALTKNGGPADTFIGVLQRWDQPAWLRPVAYQLPKITGFAGQSVTILEVVDEQDAATALSGMAEYFIEMNQIDRAVAVGRKLRQFPADLGAQVALARIEIAGGNSAESSPALKRLLSMVAREADLALPWERRISLAVVLAQGQDFPHARAQVQRCLAEMDETRLRSLAPGSLYHLQVLIKAFGLEIADQRLRALALGLLPSTLRNRL